MDLNRLVNNDAAQQPEIRQNPYTRQVEQQLPASQYQQPYTHHAHMSHVAPDRQTTYSNGALVPPAILMPTANAYGQQSYQQNHQPSPINLSPYQQQQQPSPYPATNGHYSRPSSNGYDRSPITPLQGPPPGVSPSPSTHSYTSVSAHQSPMPTIQYGLQGQPTRAMPTPPGQSLLSDSRYYEARPLGPPPQRRSAEYTTVSPAGDGQYRDSRKQSESVSPKTMPRAELSYESRSPGMQSEVTTTTPQYTNSQPQRAMTTTTGGSSSTPERPPFRRSHTMEMSNLLTPVTETPPDIPNVKIEQHANSNNVLSATTQPSQEGAERKKRPLEDAAAEMPPAKKEKNLSKRLHHHMRPPWAVYSPKNRKARNGGLTYSGPTAALPAEAQGLEPRDRNGSDRVVAAAATAADVDFEHPWRDPLPYDTDLIKARQTLGAWEKTLMWNTPLPDMLRTLQEWFYQQISQYASGVEEAGGSLEIEAKLGRLMDNNRQQPADLPILNMAIIRPAANREYRFESALALDDFKKVNGFLNQASVNSSQPGRQQIKHSRVLEEDSFVELSPLGRERIPRMLQQAMPTGRSLKLRSTKDISSGKVTARLVKIPLADLHIYNPAGYDCRVSMNAEINMMREDLPFDDIAGASSSSQPSRRKDRLSYKHLAYSVDITNVNVQGSTTYEMELEVDAQVLSKQIQLIKENKPHAFGDVVSGFLDNTTYLMRLG